MRMANGAGKRICRIRAGTAGKFQQTFHHFLHLFFFCMPVTDYRLLDLQRGVFGNDKIVQHRRANRCTTRLSEHQCGFWIDVDEHLLDCDLIGTMLGNDFIEMIHDGFQAQRQFAVRCFDTAAADIDQTAAGFIDDPETGNAQARVYAKDTDFFTCRR